jgi:outer membrane protein assembly factor BamB
MVMTVRLARAGIVLALLALSACSSVSAATQPTARPSNATQTPGTDQSCDLLPQRHAWAAEVGTAGQKLWTTSLATRTELYDSPYVQPVAFGKVAVFAQDGIVHGLSLVGGHPLWKWTGGQAVYGMWRWQDLVVVLTDQVSNHSRLTGLVAATGAIRWSLRLPIRGLLGSQAATADGGLAVVTTMPGVLEVVNMADGAIRWQQQVPASPALTAAGHLVIFGANGHLTGYDDLTGRPVWTAAGLPSDQIVQPAGGLVLVTSNAQGPGQPTALTAVDPATGQIAWRFDRGQPVSVLSAGPAGLAVTTYYNRRLYLLDPRTGRPRWQVGTFVTQGVLPLITRTAVIAAEGLQRVGLVARDAATGRIIWQDALAQPPVGSQSVVRAGSLAVLQGEPVNPGQPAPLRGYDPATGRPAWQATLPTFVAVPPVPLTGGLLVQSADLFAACPAGSRGSLAAAGRAG